LLTTRGSNLSAAQLGLLIALALQIGCGDTASQPAPDKAVKTAPDPVRITQFYASPATLVKGERTLLCYGVENSKSVILEPPRHELSNALSRCVEETPTETTTYTLTAQGASGAPISQTVTVTVSTPKPRPKLVDVQFTSLSLKSGDLLGICYVASNAASVTIEPLHFTGPGDRGCAHTQPTETTNFVVTAIAADGAKDEVRATVKVAK